MDEEKIKIDYDHIDVDLIMDKIKRKVAAEASPAPKENQVPLPQPDSLSMQERARGVLLRLMSPLKPLIKLLILPVAEEHRQTVLLLDQTNRRIDLLERDRERLARSQEYTKLLHQLYHNLVVEMSKLKIEEETLKTKVRILEKDFELLGKRERALEKEIFK